jgi:uncharacterized protein YndB with AHSA1/START domain
VITSTVLIARSPEEVFDYLSDPVNELEWNPKVEIMEKLTDGPVGVGTKWRAKWTKSKVVTLECQEYDRPRRWRHVNDGPVSVDLTVTLTPEAGGTRFVSTFDATPHGFFRVVFPVFVSMMRREEAKNMELIKQAVEGRSPG